MARRAQGPLLLQRHSSLCAMGWETRTCLTRSNAGRHPERSEGLAVETLKGNGHGEILRSPLKVAL